jgi:hypothetical protein
MAKFKLRQAIIPRADWYCENPMQRYLGGIVIVYITVTYLSILNRLRVSVP